MFVADAVKDNTSKAISELFPILMWGLVLGGVIVGSFVLWKLLQPNKVFVEKDYYTLEEALKWFKVQRKRTSGEVKGCLLKENLSGEQRFQLIHCFIDSDNRPLLEDGNYPQMIVKVVRLSEDLDDLFGGKDMVILT